MKKMSARLKTALAIDDELYHRYAAMMRYVDRRERELYRAKTIRAVFLQGEDSIYRRLRIVDVKVDKTGMVVVVKI